MKIMKGLWTNIFVLILSFSSFSWGLLSATAGIARLEAGPIIGGTMFLMIGLTSFAVTITDIINKILKG